MRVPDDNFKWCATLQSVLWQPNECKDECALRQKTGGSSANNNVSFNRIQKQWMTFPSAIKRIDCYFSYASFSTRIAFIACESDWGIFALISLHVDGITSGETTRVVHLILSFWMRHSTEFLIFRNVKCIVLLISLFQNRQMSATPIAQYLVNTCSWKPHWKFTPTGRISHVYWISWKFLCVKRHHHQRLCRCGN